MLCNQFAGSVALQAESRREFHHATERVIKERWEQARPLIPEDLHQELWNILSEPLA